MPDDPRVSEWGNPPIAMDGHRAPKEGRRAEGNGGNRNIQVPPGRERNVDFPSSGERTGRSPNRGRMPPGLRTARSGAGTLAECAGKRGRRG